MTLVVYLFIIDTNTQLFSIQFINLFLDNIIG
jgi:hypothetical protein